MSQSNTVRLSKLNVNERHAKDMYIVVVSGLYNISGSLIYLRFQFCDQPRLD